MFNDYSDLMSPYDLVSIGLYKSIDAAYMARRLGRGPDFVKLGKKILYKKESVIYFINSRLKDGRTKHININKNGCLNNKDEHHEAKTVSRTMHP